MEKSNIVKEKIQEMLEYLIYHHNTADFVDEIDAEGNNN
jgi:hypothetical protein